MIRINLAKTPNYAATESKGIGSVNLSGISVGGNSRGAKLAVMVGITAILFAYDKYSATEKKEEMLAAQQRVQQIEAEIASFGSMDEVLEGLAKEKAKVNQHMGVIQKISQKRAFKLRAVTKLQESMPDDLWLQELTMESSRINLKGLSRSPTSVQKLVKSLSDSDFVEYAMNRELSREQVGTETLQKFEIEVRVKN